MGLLTTNEAAQALRLKPSTIRKMIRDGRLEAYEVGGQRKRIDVQSIANYMQKNTYQKEN